MTHAIGFNWSRYTLSLNSTATYPLLQVPEMAWRMITPLNLHNSIVLETNEANYAKRKKSATRKKSSKSESESESLTETGKETNAVKS